MRLSVVHPVEIEYPALFRARKSKTGDNGEEEKMHPATVSSLPVQVGFLAAPFSHDLHLGSNHS